MAKNLILYYSRKGENYWNGGFRDLKKGNTEIVAEYIQKAVGGDLFEVETVREYSPSYMTCIEEAQEELRQKARPELKKYLDSIDEYDNVFVCGPCWWGTSPCLVRKKKIFRCHIERLTECRKRFRTQMKKLIS